MTMTRTERVTDIGVRLFKAFMNKVWYPFLISRLDAEEVTFLNYGYEEDPPMGLPLAASDEPTGSVSSSTTAWPPRRISTPNRYWKVSCGHGGGASYLVRTLHPASYMGLDYNPDGIAYCRNWHILPRLDFVQGDDENLPFPDESFDAVINVEASHAYPQLSRFLAEVARVLRPGGHFLYADFRGRNEFPGWEAALADIPMRQLSARVIIAGVVRSLHKNSQRSLELIGRQLPAFMRPFGRRFAGVPGTGLYRGIQSGKIEYRMYCFTKD